jgi:hypothetical protein
MWYNAVADQKKSWYMEDSEMLLSMVPKLLFLLYNSMNIHYRIKIASPSSSVNMKVGNQSMFSKGNFGVLWISVLAKKFVQIESFVSNFISNYIRPHLEFL